MLGVEPETAKHQCYASYEVNAEIRPGEDGVGRDIQERWLLYAALSEETTLLRQHLWERPGATPRLPGRPSAVLSRTEDGCRRLGAV